MVKRVFALLLVCSTIEISAIVAQRSFVAAVNHAKRVAVDEGQETPEVRARSVHPPGPPPFFVRAA